MRGAPGSRIWVLLSLSVLIGGCSSTYISRPEMTEGTVTSTKSTYDLAGLPPGTVLRMSGPQWSRPLSGQLEGAAGDSLILVAPGGIRTVVRQGDVHHLQALRKGDSAVVSSAGTGMGVGALAGALALIYVNDKHHLTDTQTWDAGFRWVGISALVGAAAGALMGTSWPTETWEDVSWSVPQVGILPGRRVGVRLLVGVGP